MSEMVERCQGALKAYWLDHSYDPSDPDDGPIRAVIASMRDPTEAMLIAGLNDAHPAAREPAGVVWRYMIDEALR